MQLLQSTTPVIQERLMQFYGLHCVWCGGEADVTVYHRTITAVDERRKDNALSACERCHYDRGDESLSAYVLRATQPNQTHLKLALRTAVAAAGSLLSRVALYEYDALVDNRVADIPLSAFESGPTRKELRTIETIRRAQATKKKERARRDGRIRQQRALYGDWCIWCGGETDTTAGGHELLRCCTKTAVNHVRVCTRCKHDRGDESVSDYALRAVNPNLSLLWSALRNIVNREPRSPLAECARIEQAALWQGIGSGVEPMLLGFEAAAGAELKRIRELAAERDGYACVWCSRELTPQTATAEHLLPRSRGGEDLLHNIAIACHKCNNERQSTRVHKWAAQSPAPRWDVLNRLGYVANHPEPSREPVAQTV